LRDSRKTPDPDDAPDAAPVSENAGPADQEASRPSKKRARKTKRRPAAKSAPKAAAGRARSPKTAEAQKEEKAAGDAAQPKGRVTTRPKSPTEPNVTIEPTRPPEPVERPDQPAVEELRPAPERVSRERLRLEFEQRPVLDPPGAVEAPRPAAAGAPRRIAFVLHAHLPWVLGHGTWPHGEEWLAEAIVHCYLPLLDALRRLADRGRRNLLTVSVTPVLAAMLADRRTPVLVERYLAERRNAAQEAVDRHPLARWWRAEFDRVHAIWDSFGHDLVRALSDLADRGAVELSTSAGTHVYLPLAHTPKLARLALRTGRETHRELFGSDPRGCWMPECAYRPGGPWRHPATGVEETFRPGNELFLQEQSLDWTVVDAHLLRAGDPAFPYLSDLPPEEVAEPGGPHPLPYRIQHSSVAALMRDARSAAQVWSRQGGYPGDGAFLDFHKRHSPSGLRLWRVTGAEVDLGDKLVYWPDDAAQRAREQAEHFVELVAGLDGMGGGVVCAPFDAELFGHWWFEGPIFLERVLELAAPATTVEATTPARELDARPTLRRTVFAEGSWGAGGDHSVWVNPATEWFWHELADLEHHAFAAVRRGGGRKWRRAILNQLLLAAASDWPFLVTMNTGGDYAEERFRQHAARLRELVALGPQAPNLPDWVDGDLPFPEIEPEWALAPEE
jgi:1,4-alpha-glucan branching enzyme